MKKRVAVLGLGYIGLPTIVAISESQKYSVVGYDVDIKKINDIKNNISPIEEKIVSQYIEHHQLDVSNDKHILKNTDIFIICVPTPVFHDFSPDYSYIKSAAKTISEFLKKGCHVVLESTVNPGTCREILIPILKKFSPLTPGVDYNVAHCPERINPGDKKWNIYNINRNIGSIDRKFNEQITQFYKSFITKANIHEVSTLEVAEATKIVENTFRDINIAYVNELAKSFDAMGVNLHETLTAASNKPFGFMAHWPGCGVGGHCIAVDPYYLIEKAARSGFNHHFLKLAREINNSMPEYTIHKLVYGLNDLGLPVKGTQVTLLGLSYKPNIGDVRESPALEIKKRLKKIGAKLITYDPYVASDCKSLSESLKNSLAIVVATAHCEFINQLPKFYGKGTIKLIIDGRNCLDKKVVREHNIEYRGIGQ